MMTPTRQNTLEQERAAFAWQEVGARPSSEYVNTAKAAPTLIMANGLMQTLAFLWSREGDRGKRLVRSVLGWLKRRNLVSSSDFSQALESLAGCGSAQYRRATEEAQEILRWIRQFADARKEG